eukprot:551399-Amphidinium_carterae.1
MGSRREIRGFLDRGPRFSEPLQDFGRVRCGRMTVAEHGKWGASHRLDMSGGVLYVGGVTQVGNEMRRCEGLQFLHKRINEVQVSALASTPEGNSPAVVPSCFTEFLGVGCGQCLLPAVAELFQYELRVITGEAPLEAGSVGGEAFRMGKPVVESQFLRCILERKGLGYTRDQSSGVWLGPEGAPEWEVWVR